MKIYSDTRINTLYVETVSNGPTTDFVLSVLDATISLYRPSLGIYDVYRMNFFNFQDADGQSFATVQDLAAYITGLLTYTQIKPPTLNAIYPLEFDVDSNTLGLDVDDITDGGNF